MSEENTGLATTNNQVATHQDRELMEDFIFKLEKFTSNLNHSPNPNKIAKHEGYEYLPISIVEKDLQRQFFGLIQYEIQSYQHVLNEFVVHARIKVYHPVLRQWLNYDGIGAGMFQQKKDTPIQDFFVYKTKNAGKLTVPNAYAEAIKNAAKKIGKRFGSDLNRKIEDNYEPFLKEKPLNATEKKHKKEVERVAHLINDAASIEELENIHPNLLEENRDLYDEKYAFLKD